MIAEVPFND